MKNDIYYNYDKLFSYNFLMAFVIGERGVGKTFGAKVAMLKKFIKNDEQFIYLRRYKTELDMALATFWSDIQAHGYFDDLSLKVRKSKSLTEFTCDGKVCGYAVPLSTSNILKSTAFPKVKTIIFDEFLLGNGGTYRYLRGEVNMILDIIETVGRLRDIQIIFLGNALGACVSPYFSYFDLDLPYNGEFRTFKDGLIVVNYIKNMAYREEKKKSRFGHLIDNTDYGRYAIDNKMLGENNNFIGKKPSDAWFLCVLIINGTSLGVWGHKNGYLYISSKYDPNTNDKFACDFNDHTESTIFMNARHNYYLQHCVRAYRNGILRFENQKIKAIACSLLNKCLAF